MSIVVRGCHIGEGRPKVIIPIVEMTESKILERAFEFSRLRVDCVEWRVDWYALMHVLWCLACKNFVWH